MCIICLEAKFIEEDGRLRPMRSVDFVDAPPELIKAVNKFGPAMSYMFLAYDKGGFIGFGMVSGRGRFTKYSNGAKGRATRVIENSARYQF